MIGVEARFYEEMLPENGEQQIRELFEEVGPIRVRGEMLERGGSMTWLWLTLIYFGKPYIDGIFGHIASNYFNVITKKITNESIFEGTFHAA